MVAVTSVIVVVVLTVLVARIATVALTVTGLSREAARFMARAALTNTGFVAADGERIVDHPVRRRIVMILMLLGNAGIVTVVATSVLSFTSAGGRGDTLLRAGILVGGLLTVLAIARNDRVDRVLSRVIARMLRRYTDLDVRDYARLLKLSDEYAVTEHTVRPEDWIVTEGLASLELTDEGIVVLGITRADGSYIGVPRGATPVRPGDVLILYGRAPDLVELDQRAAGPEGDEAHRDAVAKHQLELNVEHYRDPAVGADAYASS